MDVSGDSPNNTGINWMCEQPDALLRSWCDQFTLFVNKHPSVGRVSDEFLSRNLPNQTRK